MLLAYKHWIKILTGCGLIKKNYGDHSCLHGWFVMIKRGWMGMPINPHLLDQGTLDRALGTDEHNDQS